MRLDYPEAEPAPRMVRFGSVSYEDPYSWLEEDTEQNLAWQGEQNALTIAYLESRPGYASMGERVGAIKSSQDVLAPKYAGGRWFRQRVPDGENLAVLEIADSLVATGRRIVDLNAVRTSDPLQLQWFHPSPDGRKVAFSWSAGGRDLESFQVIDVQSGDVLLAGVPQAQANFPAWLPDSSGFYYRAHDPAVSRSSSLIFRHTLGEPPPTRPEPLDLGHPVSWPVTSADGRHVLVYSNHLEPRPDFIRDTGGGPWRPFLKDVPGMFRGVVLGDHFLAITSDRASRGRLVSIPLASPTERDTWRELVAGSDNVLASVISIGSRLILVELVDTYARLRVLRADGTIEGEIRLPGRGVVSTNGSSTAAIAFMECVFTGVDDEIVFVFSSLTESPAVYRANAMTRTSEPVTAPANRIDARVSDHTARSADGTPIPYQVVSRRDVDLSVPQPTVILQFAGFNVALLPGWPGEMLAAWIQSGGVFVLAHLRGGGEFGPEWWRAGRLARRQNTLDDLYAVAKDLFARGITTARHLAAHGVSNGGMIAAAAAVQRPDLFGAVIPQLPVTDMFALVRDPITHMIAKLEDGDPHDPVMSEMLRTWSPFQNVVGGVAYPAMLIDCGLNDPRCPSWHGRKLAARMQRATSSGRPVLLRVRAGAGHMAVGEAARRAQQTEMLAFLADQLGLAT